MAFAHTRHNVSFFHQNAGGVKEQFRSAFRAGAKNTTRTCPGRAAKPGGNPRLKPGGNGCSRRPLRCAEAPEGSPRGPSPKENPPSQGPTIFGQTSADLNSMASPPSPQGFFPLRSSKALQGNSRPEEKTGRFSGTNPASMRDSTMPPGFSPGESFFVIFHPVASSFAPRAPRAHFTHTRCKKILTVHCRQDIVDNEQNITPARCDGNSASRGRAGFSDLAVDAGQVWNGFPKAPEVRLPLPDESQGSGGVADPLFARLPASWPRRPRVRAGSVHAGRPREISMFH